jgi:serine/threonine-protein kinase
MDHGPALEFPEVGVDQRLADLPHAIRAEVEADQGVAIAHLSHPNIAKIYDIGRERDQTYIAMEFIDGETLDEFARVETRLNVHAVREAALAIHYAHGQGVIHRDIKPSNIMVSGELPGVGRPFDPARVRVYVMDFGIVKLRHNLQTTTNVLVGTPGYMSPEHVRGMEVDARSDVYSLGATLYHLLAGFPAFDSDDFAQVCHAIIHNRARPLRNIDPDIDPGLAAVVDRCLEKKPEFRYATALEMAADLESVLKNVQ